MIRLPEYVLRELRLTTYVFKELRIISPASTLTEKEDEEVYDYIPETDMDTYEPVYDRY